MNQKTLLFRTTSLERDRLIFQLGTCDPETALAAARIIEGDVAGVDVNMGCPKVSCTEMVLPSIYSQLFVVCSFYTQKFSMQGGMGAALLKTPDRARSIIHTLSSNLSIPGK